MEFKLSEEGSFQPELVSDPEYQTIIAVAHVCNDVGQDPYETFCLHVLSRFLLEGPAAPFYQSFLASGLAPSFSPGAGYDSTTKLATFSIGVQNVHKDVKNKEIEDVIRETLE